MIDIIFLKFQLVQWKLPPRDKTSSPEGRIISFQHCLRILQGGDLGSMSQMVLVVELRAATASFTALSSLCSKVNAIMEETCGCWIHLSCMYSCNNLAVLKLPQIIAAQFLEADNTLPVFTSLHENLVIDQNSAPTFQTQKATCLHCLEERVQRFQPSNCLVITQ